MSRFSTNYFVFAVHAHLGTLLTLICCLPLWYPVNVYNPFNIVIALNIDLVICVCVFLTAEHYSTKTIEIVTPTRGTSLAEGVPNAFFGIISEETTNHHK